MQKIEYLPEGIRNRYETWKQAKDTHQERANKYREYYRHDVEKTGTLYTSEQVQNIQNKNQIPLSINYIYPIIAQRNSILLQNRPSVRIISSNGGRFTKHSELIQRMTHGVFNTSKLFLQNEEVLKDMQIVGMGFMFVGVPNLYFPGEFGVTARYISYDNVILDSNSKDPSIDDHEGFFIERELTKSKGEGLYGQLLSTLVTENGDPVTIEMFTNSVYEASDIPEQAKVESIEEGKTGGILRVREYYDKVFTTMYGIEDKNGVVRRVFAENLPENDESRAILAAAEYKHDAIYYRRWLILGDYVVNVEIKPITNCPLRTIFFEWGGKVYDSYGLVHYAIGLQEAYDKVIQLLILNGILQNNSSYIAPVGSIPKKYQTVWEKFGNDPTKVKFYVPKVYGDKVFIPEKEQPGPMNEFYIMLLQLLKEGLEYVTGITPVVHGDVSENKIEVFATLQQYQSAAMQRIKLSAQKVNEFYAGIGNVVCEYLTDNILPNVKYYFYDEEGIEHWVQLADAIQKDFKFARYKCTAIPIKEMRSHELMVGDAMLKIAQSEGDPVNRAIYTQFGLKMSQIPGYGDIAEDINLGKKQQRTIEQLQATIERQQELYEQLENKFVTIDLENKTLKRENNAELKIAESLGALKKEIDMVSNGLKKLNVEKSAKS